MFAANAGAVQASAKTYIEDVFGAYVFDGTGASKTITDNIDRTKGALDIFKRRDSAVDWAWTSTALGLQKALCSNSTAGQTTDTSGVTAVSSTGITFGADSKYNASGGKFEKVTFRNALNFFQELLVTKVAGSNLVIDLSQYFPSSLLGMVKVKRTDAAGSWYEWHRSLTAGKLLIGETTAAETTLGQITVSGTTLTLVDGVIANGTYHIEAYAHDTSADGLIQCGSFTTDGSGNATVNLGWEPQWVLIKNSQTGSTQWYAVDSSRGMSLTAWNPLYPNQAYAENANANQAIYPTATGFNITANMSLNASNNHIYLAIRRGPMKKPTSGAQVYNAIARAGNGSVATVTGVGFPPDSAFVTNRDRVASSVNALFGRLRGANNYINTNATSAETNASTLTSFDQDGVTFAGSLVTNGNSYPYINHFLRRYPGVFDEVCYNGTGVAHLEPHNLTVVPELIIAKSRVGDDVTWPVTGWPVYCSALGLDGSGYLALNSASASGGAGGASYWGSVAHTSTAFGLGTSADTNGGSGNKYVALLFATLPGVSKVFNITKVAGINKDVDCQFASGARFVLLKRIDAAGDWYIWDSVRGIVAGNDPYLLLNSTAAEVTSTDYIDPYAAGFTIVDGGMPNGDYIGFAIA